MRTSGSDLTRAVEGLFAAFRPWQPLPDVITDCTYCFTAEDVSALRAEPEDLAPSALAQFIGHPPDHYNAYGSLLRRLFPPVAAALAADVLHVDAGLALHRLAQGGWRSWPQREQGAVRHYLAALLTDVLVQPPPSEDGLTAEEVLSGAASATGNVQEWLELWDSIDSPWKVYHLQALALFIAADLLQGPDADLLGWWPEGASGGLASWLLSGPGAQSLRDRPAAGPQDRRDEALELLNALRAVYKHG